MKTSIINGSEVSRLSVAIHLSGRLTEKSEQQRRTVLTTPDSVTMNCDAKKLARLFLPANVRATGPLSTQTATVLLRISD